ncbi:unnamed protein product [Meloidogyne enterolobii]|uniref:Uncharacterized protein n=1 Tax=Meloidogyne enterolobii TaxID=390850 RepID=A0ACB1B0S0_MELEN
MKREIKALIIKVSGYRMLFSLLLIISLLIEMYFTYYYHICRAYLTFYISQ